MQVKVEQLNEKSVFGFRVVYYKVTIHFELWYCVGKAKFQKDRQGGNLDDFFF